MHDLVGVNQDEHSPACHKVLVLVLFGIEDNYL